MGVKLGVSLYSYQSLFLRKLIDIEGAFKEMQKIGATGLQMLGEETPVRPRYPSFISPTSTAGTSCAPNTISSPPAWTPRPIRICTPTAT